MIWRQMDGNDGNLPFMRSAWTFHLQVRGAEHQKWHFKPSVGQSFQPMALNSTFALHPPNLQMKRSSRPHIWSHQSERGGHLRVFIPFGSVWIYLDRGPFGFKAWNRSQHICLLDSACLWFRVHGFLIELAKLSTDSLRLKLNRNEWVLV